MRKRRRSAGAVDLPKGVHRVVSRGREYFYWHPGRGTPHAGPRTRLPDDPATPEFWVALRKAQGVVAEVRAETVNDALNEFETSASFLNTSEGTQDQYRRALRIARKAWGEAPVAGLKPVYVIGMMDALATSPGKANNFLGAMRAFSAWAVGRDKIPQMLTIGAKAYAKEGGHKPWTDAQIEAARRHLTGHIRRGVMLMLYTGQRGSDMVRLCWTDVDEDGLRVVQQKTGKEVWCPILDELAAEMAGWEKVPGPFVRQGEGRAKGRPYTRKLFSIHFDAVRAEIPELAGVTLHGLRATAVIRLRRHGLTAQQINDLVGMSPAMIERYCRFADKKASGQAAVVKMRQEAGR